MDSYKKKSPTIPAKSALEMEAALIPAAFCLLPAGALDDGVGEVAGVVTVLDCAAGRVEVTTADVADGVTLAAPFSTV